MVTRTEEEEEEERCATKMLLSCQHCRLSPKIFLLWQYLKIFRKNSMLRGSHFSWLMELEDSLMSSSMFCFASRVCLCLSTSSIRKYTRHKEKYEPSLGLLPVCLFFSRLNSSRESDPEGHLVISRLILGDGTWTHSLFSSLLTHLLLAIPQLWFRRQAALAPSQFWIRLPCHYVVVAPTRVLCVRLSGALLPASQACRLEQLTTDAPGRWTCSSCDSCAPEWG